MSGKPLILYGVPFSQPVRAVVWLLLYKEQPFEMVLINPGSKGDNGSRNPAYLAKNRYKSPEEIDMTIDEIKKYIPIFE